MMWVLYLEKASSGVLRLVMVCNIGILIAICIYN